MAAATSYGTAERYFLSKGSGNTRQRHCLSHNGGGNTRQRHCLTCGTAWMPKQLRAVPNIDSAATAYRKTSARHRVVPQWRRGEEEKRRRGRLKEKKEKKEGRRRRTRRRRRRKRKRGGEGEGGHLLVFGFATHCRRRRRCRRYRTSSRGLYPTKQLAYACVATSPAEAVRCLQQCGEKKQCFRSERHCSRTRRPFLAV